MGQEPKIHLFICTHRREDGECCATKGAQSLRDEVKLQVKKLAGIQRSEVRINSAGCLGRCEEGIAAVLYPTGKWFTGLSAEDASRLVEEVKAALTRPR